MLQHSSPSINSWASVGNRAATGVHRPGTETQKTQRSNTLTDLTHPSRPNAIRGNDCIPFVCWLHEELVILWYSGNSSLGSALEKQRGNLAPLCAELSWRRRQCLRMPGTWSAPESWSLNIWRGRTVWSSVCSEISTQFIIILIVKYMELVESMNQTHSMLSQRAQTALLGEAWDILIYSRQPLPVPFK